MYSENFTRYLKKYNFLLQSFLTLIFTLITSIFKMRVITQQLLKHRVAIALKTVQQNTGGALSRNERNTEGTPTLGHEYRQDIEQTRSKTHRQIGSVFPGTELDQSIVRSSRWILDEGSVRGLEDVIKRLAFTLPNGPSRSKEAPVARSFPSVTARACHVRFPARVYRPRAFACVSATRGNTNDWPSTCQPVSLRVSPCFCFGPWTRVCENNGAPMRTGQVSLTLSRNVVLRNFKFFNRIRAT